MLAQKKACLWVGMCALSAITLVMMLLTSAVYTKDSPSLELTLKQILPVFTNQGSERQIQRARVASIGSPASAPMRSERKGAVGNNTARSSGKSEVDSQTNNTARGSGKSVVVSQTPWPTTPFGPSPSPTFESFYKNYTARVSAILTSGDFSKAQFIVHQSGPWGIGNRLTALVSSFLIGFLTNRIVLTTYPDFYRYYDPHGLPNIHFNTYAKQFSADPRFSAQGASLNIECDWDFPELLASSNLSQIWESKHVVYLWCQDYPIPYLLGNDLYSDILMKLFPSFEPFHDIATRIVVPSKAMRPTVEKFTKRNFRKHKQMIGIHTRFHKHFPTRQDPLSIVFGSFAESLRLRLGLPDGDVGYFIACDSESGRDELIAQLNVLTGKTKKEKDIYFLVPGDTLGKSTTFGNPGTEESAHADLLLLASCNHLIVTFSSSFGQVAAGIAGISAYSVVGAPSEGWPKHTAWVATGASSEPCPFLMKKVMEHKWHYPWAYKLRTLPTWVHYTQCHEYCC